ncbi:MAG: VOC family protein [Rhizobiales bacterium]|nr:VOC family protein [Hyphomicrobiales bacterium]
MQVNPYIFFNGNCEAALNYYQKVLGARIEAIIRYESAPPDMPTPPEWKQKVMHAKITIDGEVLMASDAPPGHFNPPQGFAVSLQVENPGDAAVRFRQLSDSGTVTMPFGKTFFSNGFGMCIDKFGTPWMVNSPLDD